MPANTVYLFLGEVKMAKDKQLKRKAAPIVKKVSNEWLDATIEPSDDEEVCIYSFDCLHSIAHFEVKRAPQQKKMFELNDLEF